MSPTPGAPSLYRHSGTPVYAIGDGGPLTGTGVGNAASFFGRRSVRDTWIAIWVLWIVWAMLFIAKQLFRTPRAFDVPRSERVTSSNAPVVGDQGPYDVHHDGLDPIAGAVGARDQDQTSLGDGGAGGVGGVGGVSGAGATHRPGNAFFQRAADNVRDRIDRTYNLIRDLTLMLMVVVTVNTFGLGSGIAVLILTWIYLAIALLWAGLMMLIESRIIDVILGTLQMLILLAILIAAYAIGWAVLD
ncbi:hypothetical protein BGZ95_008350 [Linnemannia exigua]|uniref:Uncharacterized protein n=1 Tax=Linnemannia exigua TaxID=604196 RepID=A0AAD4H7T5_9FUNG|nr:hypothetical protein BGZ95_008350 [Linnemannia exigua]